MTKSKRFRAQRHLPLRGSSGAWRSGIKDEHRVHGRATPDSVTDKQLDFAQMPARLDAQGALREKETPLPGWACDLERAQCTCTQNTTGETQSSPAEPAPPQHRPPGRYLEIAIKEQQPGGPAATQRLPHGVPRAPREPRELPRVGDNVSL